MAYVFSHGYLKRGGFPHSDIYGSKLVCQLPEAFRRLPRPSSPVIAKASTTCTYSLDPITLSAPLQQSAFSSQLSETTTDHLHSSPEPEQHSYRSYFSAWLPSPRLSTRQRYN